MPSPQLDTHISRQFNDELEDIRTKVLTMGGLVEEHLRNALEALARSDAGLARKIAGADYKVNALEVEIDEECTEILARRQPAASDLRMVIAVTKIITDMERIGDEAEKIARVVQRLVETESPKSYYLGVLSMGNQVRHTVHNALNAFARMDAEAALQIAKQDMEVDRAYDAILRQLITYMMEDPRSITRVLDVVWAIRALERIGDHANNICESIIYFVKGKDIRHISLEDAEKELHAE
jgi:phosphate transport system protein